MTGVNIDEHKVDFELVSKEETEEEPAKKGRRGQREGEKAHPRERNGGGKHKGKKGKRKRKRA